VIALALAIAVGLALTLAATWRRRGGGLLPLALGVVVLSPVALVGWLAAELWRLRLARPARVRSTLAQLGLGALARGRTVRGRRIGQGDMNAVLRVTLSRPGEPDRHLVLKHLLRFGTLLAWTARELGATREYPRPLGATARTIREVRAMGRLRRASVAAPRCLGFSVRRRVEAMEWIEGGDLAAALPHDPRLPEALGQLLARMHAAGVAMGDANPRNMAVDGAGRIVPFDLELSHLGGEATCTKRGFDLAWAAAFLPEEGRARLFDAYGARSPALEQAVVDARVHLVRFHPLIDWFARRWSAPRAAVAS
jgi:hypothetical protein